MQEQTKICVLHAMSKMNLHASPNTIRLIEMDSSEHFIMEERKHGSGSKVFLKRTDASTIRNHDNTRDRAFIRVLPPRLLLNQARKP